MKVSGSGFLNSSKYTKILYWGKLVTITGASQIVVQLLSLACGIIIIRLLPVNEYAWYTIANTLFGTMTILADGGIAAGVMAEGGKVWLDKDELGKVIATGLDLRKRFAIGSLLVGIPLLIYLLHHHNADYIAIILISLSLIPSFFAAVSDSLLEVTPKLHQDIKSLQKNLITVNIIRFFFTLPLFVFPFTFIAVMANGFPRMYGNIQLKKISDKFISAAQPDPEIKKRILKVVAKILPGSIYYCISGQLTIFLISFLGNTISIGQIGALGRLSSLLTVLSGLFTTLIVPRFARLKDNYKQLLKIYFIIMVVNFFILIAVIIFVFFFSNIILYVIGNQYKNLKYELVLVVMSNCASLMAGYNYALSTSRGWVLNPAIAISLHLLSVVAGILIFSFSTLDGALYYNLFLEVILAIVGIIYCTIMIFKQKRGFSQ